MDLNLVKHFHKWKDFGLQNTTIMPPLDSSKEHHFKRNSNPQKHSTRSKPLCSTSLSKAGWA